MNSSRDQSIAPSGSESATGLLVSRGHDEPAHGNARLKSSKRTDRDRGRTRAHAPAPQAAVRRPAPPAIVLHDPPGIPPLRWSAPLSWLVIAAAGAALLWIAFGHHPIGDYATESDFYGGYVDGARLWQQLRPDPARYAVA